MAQKRQFDKTIPETYTFQDLPASSIAMYFLLGMFADDDGFIHPRAVLNNYSVSKTDVEVLIAKGYLIPFPTGVLVIVDWKRNNWFDKRRVKPTLYIEEKNLLVEDNGTYFLRSSLPSISEVEVEPVALPSLSQGEAEKNLEKSTLSEGLADNLVDNPVAVQPLSEVTEVIIEATEPPKEPILEE